MFFEKGHLLLFSSGVVYYVEPGQEPELELERFAAAVVAAAGDCSSAGSGSRSGVGFVGPLRHLGAGRRPPNESLLSTPR